MRLVQCPLSNSLLFLFINATMTSDEVMETFSALLTLCAGNSSVAGEFLSQRQVTWSFDVFLDLRMNKRLRNIWFETPSWPLWRHCNTTWHLQRPWWRWIIGVPQCNDISDNIGFDSTSSISSTKCKNLNVYHLVLQLYLHKPLNPSDKPRMKM